MSFVAPIATPSNSGIVPPWITAAANAGTNPGIVPPWLLPTPDATNPGIVPPWLSGAPTTFESVPVDVTPTLADALRAR